jgi:hypothetical protein
LKSWGSVSDAIMADSLSNLPFRSVAFSLRPPLAGGAA